MKMLKKSVLAVIMILVCTQVVSATDPLLVSVNCHGCSTRDEYNFYANAGETITFTVSSTGGTGSKSYEWTKDGTLVHDSIDPFPITVTGNAEYILTVTDSGGYTRKTVKIISVSQEKPKCLPIFGSDIIIDDRLNREEYSVGDSFTVKVRLDTRDCPDSDYKFYWKADDPNVIFVNPNSTRTEVRVGQGTKNGDVKIEAIITNGEVVRRPENGEIKIKIVSNTPPQFEIEHSKPPIYSCERFEVWPSNFKPGERGESKDFLHSYSAVLKNESGRIVSSAASRTVARNGKVLHLRLEPDGFKEIYSIEMTVVDSHGASTTKVEYIGNISRGKNDRNPPVVYAPDIIHCTVGEVCKIDASETMDEDEYVSNFRFYDVVAKEDLLNLEGNTCSGPVCKHIFTYPGTYKIRIKANYFDDDNRRESEVGSKVVTVIVSPDNVSVTPTPVLTATPTPTIAFTPEPVTRARTDTAEEPKKKEGVEKILSDVIDIIKNALEFFKERFFFCSKFLLTFFSFLLRYKHKI